MDVMGILSYGLGTLIGFVLLVAWDKAFMGRLIRPGLSIGIVLGALVIVSCWVLTWVYVRWANTRYDPELKRLRDGGMKGLGGPWPPA